VSRRQPSFLLPAFLAVAGCTQEPPPSQFRSLEASGDLSFICVTENFEPREMRDCPDQDPGVDLERRRVVTLVTQTTRGEVALVDTSSGVVDVERSIPGFNFLPVGAQPIDIVSTPGSTATFVGVGEVGHEGIFALPTRCIGPRDKEDAPRDITSWPACRLPTTPGDMAVLVDPPDEAGVVRSSCGALGGTSPEALARNDSACSADLSGELDPPGRRKLLVALPEWGELAVIDAQWLLDRPPGTYEPCVFDERLALAVDLPSTGISQRPPPDLDVSACPLPGLNHGPRPETFSSRPAGFALAEDRSQLYVADREAPVIHVLDTSDPCNLAELPPLLAASFVDPNRVVTTHKVAVSPLTRDARRFLYAIDQDDNGSLMIFDVSEGSADRTPLIRPRSAEFPFEPPDRIAFGAPAKDVAFGYHERALRDPPLGSAIDGILCDPDPRAAEGSPGALRRPARDFSTGAGPFELRGIFAFAALSTGQIAVIDVEDWDAPCRRPIHPNPGPVEDFRGCANDPTGFRFYTAGGEDPSAPPTVTDEVSCQVVQPHRARSQNVMINTPELRAAAPALTTMPQLVSKVGRRLPTDQSEEGRTYPKMLGVDFSSEHPAQVYVQSVLRTRGADGDLVIDPALAEESSLVLSFAEPRAYAAAEQFLATYEGIVIGERPAARLVRKNSVEALLIDSGIVFCDAGVEGVDQIREYAEELGADIGAFSEAHADFVVIKSSIPDEDSAYWRTGIGATCGGASPDQPGASHAQCRALLGTAEAPNDRRALKVRISARSELTVKPVGNLSRADQEQVLDLLACCFPEPVSYEVRASRHWIVRGSVTGFRHRVTTNPFTGECFVDRCNPLRARFVGRAFEISCPAEGCPVDVEDGLPVIGEAVNGDACVTSNPGVDYKVRGEPGYGCVFSDQKTSFAIYRGLRKSERDMTFAWEAVGGFTAMAADLRLIGGAQTVPVSMSFVPELGALALTDGAQKGVAFLPLSSFDLVPRLFQ
jgi:hypothetical protein